MRFKTIQKENKIIEVKKTVQLQIQFNVIVEATR